MLIRMIAPKIDRFWSIPTSYTTFNNLKWHLLTFVINLMVCTISTNGRTRQKKIIIWMLALTEGWHSYSVSNWSNYWQWLLVFVRACACICVSAGAQMCAWALSIESSSGWDSSIWSILSSIERIHHWNRVIDFVMIILRWSHFVQLFMFRIMLKNEINYAICAHTAAKHIQRERER